MPLRLNTWEYAVVKGARDCYDYIWVGIEASENARFFQAFLRTSKYSYSNALFYSGGIKIGIYSSLQLALRDLEGALKAFTRLAPYGIKVSPEAVAAQMAIDGAPVDPDEGTHNLERSRARNSPPNNHLTKQRRNHEYPWPVR